MKTHSAHNRPKIKMERREEKSSNNNIWWPNQHQRLKSLFSRREFEVQCRPTIWKIKLLCELYQMQNDCNSQPDRCEMNEEKKSWKSHKPVKSLQFEIVYVQYNEITLKTNYVFHLIVWLLLWVFWSVEWPLCFFLSIFFLRCSFSLHFQIVMNAFLLCALRTDQWCAKRPSQFQKVKKNRNWNCKLILIIICLSPVQVSYPLFPSGCVWSKHWA